MGRGLEKKNKREPTCLIKNNVNAFFSLEKKI